MGKAKKDRLAAAAAGKTGQKLEPTPTPGKAADGPKKDGVITTADVNRRGPPGGGMTPGRDYRTR